ncbi:hypothetical protein ETI10_01635 [Macrococcoides goetzii]|nr:hypothetical protein [Macrococcus goetzii]TDM41815.1 hypothetical protein ETI10_01635 [Macrococcus goetzii]
MKIKQRKYMSEKEALHWLVDNTELIDGIDVGCNEYGDGFFECQFKYDEHLGWTKDGRYYVEGEIEIDGDTKLDVVVVYDEYSGNKNHVGRVFRTSINQIIKINNDGNIKYVNIQNEDGSIGELIWSKERGLVD